MGAASNDPNVTPGAEAPETWTNGDAGAIDRAHRRYRGRLENVAFRILGNRSDAEDVVQQVFMALQRVDFQQRSSLWTYLYRAAVNGSVNVIRSRKRQQARHAEVLQQECMRARPTGHDPEAQVLEGEILGEVARALVSVKPKHRRVLVLRIVWGLSNTEIAEREGLPLATVGTWLRRGREDLRKGLGPLLQDLGRNSS